MHNFIWTDNGLHETSELARSYVYTAMYLGTGCRSTRQKSVYWMAIHWNTEEFLRVVVFPVSLLLPLPLHYMQMVVFP